MKSLAYCIGLALAQWSLAGSAIADTAIGVDSALGNVLVPASVNPIVERAEGLDPDGMGVHETPDHTPTGQTYNWPPASPDAAPQSGVVHATAEIGGIGVGGDKNAAVYKMYKDVSESGVYVTSFSLGSDTPETARFMEVIGGNPGRDDQFFGASMGRYNSWKIKAFYNETPHVFTTTYRNIWDGVGSDHLTLKPGYGLVAGGTPTALVGPNPADATNIIAAGNANADTELKIIRKKGGLAWEQYLTNNLKFIASATSEDRKGARPFGMVAGQGGGGGATTPFLEIPESIDYKTTDILAGLRWADDLNSLNVNVSASLFRNSIDTQTIENPLYTGAAAPATSVVATGLPNGAFTQGRFDLVPDNEAYNLKAEYARFLPGFAHGTFTLVAAYGTNRQNDNLIPYTSIPLTGTTTNNVIAGANGGWDTTGSLSTQSANARIDTKLLDLGLALSPTDNLSVKGKVRRYELKNKTVYYACNPNAQYADNDPGAVVTVGGTNAFGCNGVWGRVLNDGAGGSLFNPAVAAPTSTVPIRNIPWQYTQTNTGLTADYKLSKTSTVNAALEREEFERSYRERDKTWEDKVKLGYVSRGIPRSTLRMSYEYDTRRGDEYHAVSNRTQFYSGALYPYLPTTVALPVAAYQTTNYAATRKYDISDRDQNILNARFNRMFTPTIDGGVGLQVKQARFPNTELGLADSQTQKSLNLDVNYVPSAEQTGFAYVSRQESKQKMNSAASAYPNGYDPVTGLPAAGYVGGVSPTCTGYCANIYNPGMAWSANVKDANNVVGVGFSQDFGKVRLQANFTRTQGVTKIHYAYKEGTANAGAVPGTGALTPANALLAGNDMPDMKFSINTLETSLSVPFSKMITGRLVYRLEQGQIEDWHYTSIQDTSGVSAAAATGPVGFILDAGPQDYRTYYIGALVQVKL
jgi:hypothetical protein